MTPAKSVTMSQDWANIVIGSKINTSQGPKVAGTSTPLKLSTSSSTNTVRTLDAATEPVRLKELSRESRQDMISARAANKLTQVELNQRCAFPANTIREMEAGRLTPNQKQISILQRILKIQLKVS